MTDNLEKNDVLAALRARLELEAGMGVDFLPCPGFDPAMLEADAAIPRVVPRPAASPLADPPRERAGDIRRFKPNLETPSRPASPPPKTDSASEGGFVSLVPATESASSPEKEALLGPTRSEAATCGKCGLCERRQSVVFGEGSLDTRVMFIGEGPGRDEDEQGRPFVGRSGRLLTDIIEKGMKLPRNQVYITNVVKCRPPGNRDPRPEEVAACGEYLRKQIEVIKPKVIVAVGGVAGCALLGLPPKSPGLRGKWHQYDGIPMRVIYHPSYLLRQRRSAGDRTKADSETWKDIVEVMKLME